MCSRSLSLLYFCFLLSASIDLSKSSPKQPEDDTADGEPDDEETTTLMAIPKYKSKFTLPSRSRSSGTVADPFKKCVREFGSKKCGMFKKLYTAFENYDTVF